MTLERGQIIWANFTPQKGHEQAGRRPALVISPTVYNEVSNCIIVCPITSNTAPWPWKVILPDEYEISGAILVDQVKSIDQKARNVEGTGQTLMSDMLDDVLSRLATLTGG